MLEIIFITVISCIVISVMGFIEFLTDKKPCAVTQDQSVSYRDTSSKHIYYTKMIKECQVNK